MKKPGAAKYRCSCCPIFFIRRETFTRMLKITGFDKLQRELEEAQRALETLDGELGTINFIPDDPASIEAAIQSVYAMIDERAGVYASNPIIGPLIEQMKETYREKILQKAAEARLQEKEDK